MKTIVAFHFEMLPRPGQTSRECLAAVRGELSDWVGGIFRGLGVHDLQLPFDGSCVEPAPEHEVLTEEHTCATHQTVVLNWRFTDPRMPAIGWSFTGTVVCDNRTVAVELVVKAGWHSCGLRPLNVALSAGNPLSSLARLRDKLMLGWKCQLAGQPIPTRARPLRKNQVDAFAREVLLNPKRVLPVVLMKLGGPVKIDLDSLHNLQGHLLGLAHVAGLLDEPAVDRLAKVLGPKVFAKEAVLRVYWPGLLQDDLPQSHPFQTWEQLQQNLKTGPLPRILLDLLSPVSAEQSGEAPRFFEAFQAVEHACAAVPRADPSVAERLAAAEAEAERARQAQQRLERESQAGQRRLEGLLDELADLRAQVVALRADRPEVKSEELAAELERAWDENARLRQDWEAARRQAVELETDFRNYLDSSALLWEAPDAPNTAAPFVAAGGRGPATVADALRSAAAEFADILTVWDDAERSAEQCSFGSPAKVFQALEAIAVVGRAYFKARHGGPPLGPMDRAFLSHVPFKYTCFESPTTLGIFGAERVFHRGGQSRQMQRHLTLGGGTTNNCLQLYFDFDNATQRVLIGYCGRHLPFARQRT